MFTLEELCNSTLCHYGAYAKILGYLVTPGNRNNIKAIDCLIMNRTFRDQPLQSAGGKLIIVDYVVCEYQTLTLPSGKINTKRKTIHGFVKPQHFLNYQISRNMFLSIIIKR